MSRAQNLAVVVTCLIAAMTYAGAVTMQGMAMFVLPGVVGAAALGSLLAARRMFGTALIVGGALVLAWSEVVNIWSGIADGPAARSTAVAAGCTLIAVVAARSSSPALFLLPVAGSVCGALLLGAGSEVRSVAVATAVSAALTLGLIEHSRRNWAARPRRGPGFGLVSVLIGAVAAACVLLQVQRDSRPPQALAAGRVYTHIKPPWRDPLGTVTNKIGALRPTDETSSSPPSSSGRHTNPPRSRHNPPPPKTQKPPASHRHTSQPLPRKHSSPSRIWLYVLAGIVLLLLAVVARLITVRLAWRRLRRRLAAGAPAEQITGAWTWLRIRLDACRLPLAAAVSPDLVVAGAAGSGLPPEVFTPLQTLAAATTTAAFAGVESLGADEATGAWRAAGEADASARDSVSRRTRARLAFRGPTSRAKTR